MQSLKNLLKGSIRFRIHFKVYFTTSMQFSEEVYKVRGCCLTDPLYKPLCSFNRKKFASLDYSRWLYALCSFLETSVMIKALLRKAICMNLWNESMNVQNGCFYETSLRYTQKSSMKRYGKMMNRNFAKIQNILVRDVWYNSSFENSHYFGT